MADYTNYNSDNISIVKIGNKNYTIVDNPLRSSFKKLSDVIKTNNQTVKDFMNQSNFQHATTAYQLNDSNSFLYAFSNICLDKISNLETNKADKTTVTTLSNTVSNNKKSIDDTLGSVASEKGLLYDISYLYGVVGETENSGLRKDLISYNTRITNLENNKLDKSTFNDKIGSTHIQGTVTGVLSDLYNKVGNPQTDNTIIHSVGELEAIVGTDYTKGLRKDVANLQNIVGTDNMKGLRKDVSDLKGTIGDTSSGMTHDLSQHERTLSQYKTTLSKHETTLSQHKTTLSQHKTTIDNLINHKANQSYVDKKITELTNLLNDLTYRVTKLENMSYAH